MQGPFLAAVEAVQSLPPSSNRDSNQGPLPEPVEAVQRPLVQTGSASMLMPLPAAVHLPLSSSASMQISFSEIVAAVRLAAPEPDYYSDCLQRREIPFDRPLPVLRPIGPEA